MLWSNAPRGAMLWSNVIFDVVDHVIYVAVDVMTVVVVVSSDGVLQLLNLYFQKRDCQMTET